MKNFSLIFSTICFLCLIPVTSLHAQHQVHSFTITNSTYKHSELKFQVLFENGNPVSTVKEIQSKKSPVLAGVLSLLIPGTGQAYNGQWIKAGIQWALLAGSIYLAVYDVNFDSSGEPLPTSSVVGISIGAATWIWSVVDAVISANSINRQRQVQQKTYLRDFKGKGGISFKAAGQGMGLSIEF